MQAVTKAKQAGVPRFVYVSVGSAVKDNVQNIAMKGYFQGKSQTEAAIAVSVLILPNTDTGGHDCVNVLILQDTGRGGHDCEFSVDFKYSQRQQRIYRFSVQDTSRGRH